MSLIMSQTLACLLCLGAGLLGWRYVLAVSRREGVASLVPIMLMLGLAVRILVAVGIPDFYAPDEHSHFNYVKYLAEHRAFPVQASMTGASTQDWEYYQPPLYYLAQWPVYLAAQKVFGDVPRTMLAMRLFSVALWGVTAWATLRFLRAMRIQDGVLTMAVIAMACLLPSHVFISSSINNDNMALCMGALMLAVVARADLSWRAALAVGGLLGLALLSKFSAVVYGVLLVALVAGRQFMGQQEGQQPWPRALGYLAVAGGVAALLLAPWVLRNLAVYGSATAEHVANIPVDWGKLWGNLAQKNGIDIPWPAARVAVEAFFMLLNMFLTFWSVSGCFNDVYGVFPLVGVVFGGLAVRSAWRCWRSPASSQPAALDGLFDRAFLWAMLLALAVNIALVLRFGLLYGQAQGRFIFPMMVPIALLLGLGVKQWRWCARDAAAHLAGFFWAYTITFVGFSLATLPARMAASGG